MIELNPDGSGRRTIDIVPGSHIAPTGELAWSADGKCLGVEGSQFGSHEWVVRPDRTGLKKIF